ncbi:collagenase [Chitinimonas sp. PSY-7]|uniref:collagenase n=1 Tax=Chitinimonas sp. PSY-7 TaxID=3459088 RepID=UPI0040401412
MPNSLKRSTIACLWALGALTCNSALADVALPKNIANKSIRANGAKQDKASQTQSKGNTPVMAMAFTRCDLNTLDNYRDWELVEKVKTAGCSNGLFDVNSTQAAIFFNESQMLKVASEFRRVAAAYDGTNNSHINELQEYLRAGYYYQSNNKTPEYSSTLKNEIRAGLVALFASSGSRKIWWENGDILESGYKLITHTKDFGYFVPTMKAKLAEASPEFMQSESTAGAVFELLRLFNGLYYYDKAGTEIVKRDTSYANTVYNLLRNNKNLIGTKTEYVLGQTISVLGEMLQFQELKEHVRPLIRDSIAGYGMFGRGDTIWLSAANKVREYDNKNCSSYNMCDAKEKWEAAMLTSRRDCAPNIKILSQGYSDADLAQACQLLSEEHKLFTYSLFGVEPGKANIIPTKYNAGLEVIAFKTKEDYSKYGYAIYGINTDNGGITMEGDPSRPGNVQHFYAYHKEGQPLIWNLKHEFIHYIDNIYNIENYGKAYFSGQPIVWWMEGLGEYFSLENNNPSAIEVAKLKTYPLSTIFRNTYDMADYQIRCYRWGYLAMRFMFERHRDDIEQVAAALRAGNYDEYGRILFNRIGTRYDSEFSSWLDTVNNSGSFAGARYAGGKNNAKGDGNEKPIPTPTGKTTFDPDKQYHHNDVTMYDGKYYRLSVLTNGKPNPGYGLYGSTCAPSGPTHRNSDGQTVGQWVLDNGGTPTPTPTPSGSFDIYQQYRHGDRVQLNGKVYSYTVMIDGKPGGNYALYGGSCEPTNCTSYRPFRTSDNRVMSFWQEGQVSGGGTTTNAGTFSRFQQYRDQDQTVYEGRTYRFTVKVDGRNANNYPLYGGSCIPTQCQTSTPFVSSDGRSTAYWQ